MAKKSYIDQMPTPKMDAHKQTQEYKDFKAKYDKMSKKKGGGLVPVSQMTPDMREEMTRLSMIASEEKRKNTLALNTTLESIMSLPLMDDDAMRIILEQRGIEDDKITEATAMSYALVQRARVDTRSFEVLRDTIGQKPVERQEVVQANIDANEILKRHFG